MKYTVLLLSLLLVAIQPAQAQFEDRENDVEAARINARLGIEYMKLGQLAVAREKIDKALRENPRDPSVQMSAGVLYEQLREPDKAEDHYRQALRLDGTNPDVQNAYGAFLCRKGEAKRGEEMFLKAAHNPLYRTPEVALTNAGVCARGAGRLEKSEDYLRQAIALPVQYPEALLQLAGVSFERKNYLQARAFLQRYLAKSPGSAAVMLLGYQVEKALGDTEAMNGYAGRLRDKYPDSPEARILDEPAKKETQ